MPIRRWANIELWTFDLPAVRDRPEDIKPNLRDELEKYAAATGVSVTFNKEAQQRFLRFATSSGALWTGNFRDLNAAVTRMATLSGGGRITVEIVDEEIARLERFWQAPEDRGGDDGLSALLPEDELAKIDSFDLVQLAEVIRVCRAARNLSEAGRQLFSASRQAKTTNNDADRLRKYLARFKIDWRSLHRQD